MRTLAMESGFRAAPTALRLVAGLVDLAVEAALGAALAWWLLPAEEWPPRYWNLMDYAVDIACHHPDLAARAAWPFVVVFLVWETLWGRAAGNTPFARILGMRIVTSRGRRPGVLRLGLRAILSLAGGLLAFTGPLLAIVHPRRRMLHDMMTRCHVLLGAAPPDADARPDDAEAPALRGGPYRDGPFRGGTW